MIEFIPISRMFFMPFSDGLIDFWFLPASFPAFFCCLPAKKALLFFHPDHPFSRFFRFIGIFFLSSAEKFFHPIPVFSVLFLNSFRRKSLFFRLPLPVLGHFSLTFRIIFKFFPVPCGKFFSPYP